MRGPDLSLAKIGTIVGSGAVGGITALFVMQLLQPIAMRAGMIHSGPSEITPISYHVDANDVRSVVIPRGSDLSYRISAQIKGRPLDMLVDSGANITVLSLQDAKRLQIPINPHERAVKAVGVNNIENSYRYVGDLSISIGPIVMTNVPVSVDESGTMRTSIMGQTSFCNIGKITIVRDVLEFRNQGPVSPGCPLTLPI